MQIAGSGRLSDTNITIMRLGRAIMEFNRAAVLAEAWDQGRGRMAEAWVPG